MCGIIYLKKIKDDETLKKNFRKKRKYNFELNKDETKTENENGSENETCTGNKWINQNARCRNKRQVNWSFQWYSLFPVTIYEWRLKSHCAKSAMNNLLQKNQKSKNICASISGVKKCSLL